MAALALIGLPIVAADTRPARADDCAIAEAMAAGDWFNTVMARFWQRPPAEPPAEPELLFTIRSGFALGRKCDLATGKRYRRLIYYPVGLAVQKLDTAVEQAGGRKYVRVRAVYGMELLIQQADIVPLSERVKGYIFVDGPQPVPYCAVEGCDDPTRSPAGGLVLTAGGGSDGTGRYGVVADLQRTVEGCRSFKFYPFERGERISAQSVFLNDCWEGFASGGMKLKFLSAKAVAREFQYAGKGGVHGGFSPGQLQALRLQFRTYKDCQTEDTFEAGGEFSLGGDYYIFSGSLSTAARTKSVRSKDYYHYFSHYYMDGKAFGIESSAHCPDGDPVPTKPKFVQVYHRAFDTGYFSLSVPEIVNRYAEQFGLAGYKPTASTHLRRGKFFEVCGTDQYFYLRDLFRGYMEDISDVLETVSDTFDDQEELRFLVDYYTHVLMASTVRLSPRCS